MARSPMQSWRALAGLVVVTALSSGCRGNGHSGASPSDTTITLIRLAVAEHDSIVREADSLYDFGTERATVMVDDPAFQGPVVDDGRIPHMTIATAKLKVGTPQPAHRIIARIRSDAPYTKMGVQAGYNYVWRNSWSDADTASWLTQIVARDSATAHDLIRDSRRHEYTHGMSPKEPRLVILKVHSIALALCLDDPMCSTGHCGYY